MSLQFRIQESNSQTTPATGDIELYGIICDFTRVGGIDDYDLSNFRVRTFFNHHFLLSATNTGHYYGLTNIQSFQGAGGFVSDGYDDWRSPTRPPRIDTNKFCSEVIIYPPNVILNSSVPSAYDGRFQLTGKYDNNNKIGRYHDIETSYSYLYQSGYHYNPLNWVMEERDNTKTISITNISTIGSTVTVVTNGDHGFSSGESITITGLNSNKRSFGNYGERYEGNFKITVTGNNTFTYTTTHVTQTPTTHTSGIVEFWNAFVYDDTINTIQGDGNGNVTVTFSNYHSFEVGDLIAIENTINYNGNALEITSISSTSFVCKINDNTSTTSESTGIFKFSCRVPSAAVGINYVSGYEQKLPDDHTEFTYLLYADKDTYIDNMDRTTDYGNSTLVSLKNFTNSNNKQKRYILMHFPINGISMSQLIYSEIGLYYDNGDDNNTQVKIYQGIDETWTESDTWNTHFSQWNEGDPIPPVINHLFDPSVVISNHSFESVNQSENDTYIKFNVDNNIILNWLTGNSNPDIVCSKENPDDSINNIFRTNENIEERPYIIVSSGVIADQIPPILEPINVVSTFKGDTIQGDGSGKITVTSLTPHKLSAGDYVNVISNNYEIYHTPVLDGVDAPTSLVFKVSIPSNPSTTTDSNPVFTRFNIIDVYMRATDDIEVSGNPTDTTVNIGTGLTPMIVNDLTKSPDTVLTFNVTTPDLDDGYFEATTIDAAGNNSNTINPPILAEYQNITTGKYNVIRPGDSVFMRGLNIENALELRIGDSSLEGGIVSGGYPQSIGIGDINAGNNGFLFDVPNHIQNEYNVISVDDTANTILIENSLFNINDLVSFNSLGTGIAPPIKVGKFYTIISVTSIGNNAEIQISDAGIGGAPLDLTAPSGTYTMYAYNASTTAYVIKDGYTSSDYNSIMRLFVDEYGPKINIPTIIGTGDTITVTISDLYEIDTNSILFTNGTQSSNIMDVNGDGRVIQVDVDITGNGTFRVDISDTNGNTTIKTQSIPAITLPYIEIVGYTINLDSTFELNVRVTTNNNVPAIEASNNSTAGIFVEGNINNSTYGTLSNFATASNELTFDITVDNIGSGVMTIYATTTALDSDSITPPVLISVTPECVQDGNEISISGINLNRTEFNSMHFINNHILINNTTMTLINGTILNGHSDGIFDLTYAPIIGSDTILSNTISTTIDNTPPIITILGDQVTEVIIGDSYDDLGATAIDNISGDVTDRIVTQGMVNVNTLGTYHITYTVTDNCGNESVAVRIVNVVTGCPIYIDVSPKIGFIGDTVIITATNGEFNPIPINNIVTFNGIISQVLNGSRSELLVTVPFGATSGQVQVETGHNNTGYEQCSLSNIDYFTVAFIDEKFESEHNVDNTITTSSGRISPFLRGPNESAIYNRDLAYTGYSEVTDENSMIQNIYSIILTRTGERLFNPDFGVGIESYIHQIVDDVNSFEKKVLDDVVTSINQYEPRVIIDRRNSFIYFKADENDIKLILSVIVPSGNVRKIGITLSSINNGEPNI